MSDLNKKNKALQLACRFRKYEYFETALKLNESVLQAENQANKIKTLTENLENAYAFKFQNLFLGQEQILSHYINYLDNQKTKEQGTLTGMQSIIDELNHQSKQQKKILDKTIEKSDQLAKLINSSNLNKEVIVNG